MDYRKLFAEDNASVKERYDLVMERISQIGNDMKELNRVGSSFRDYFKKMSEFILDMGNLYTWAEEGALDTWTFEQWQAHNFNLYKDILPENYETGYANPAYAVAVLGENYGQLLSFLYTEIRGMIVYALEGRLVDMTILCELFVEIFGYFTSEELPEYKWLQQAVYWYISDYSDLTMEYSVREMIDDDLNYLKDIICQSDANDLSYLYRYGEYIGENEIRLAQFLGSLPEEEIAAMADTFVDGYIRGFKVMGVDLSKKKSVCIRGYIGFERVLKVAIAKFEAKGLRVHLFRNATASINKKSVRSGYMATTPNPQYDYDHRQDNALYMDKALNERKLAVLRVVYEKYKKPLEEYAGPAVWLVFGEKPFEPVNKPECLKYNEKQQKLFIDYSTQSGLLTNQYMNHANMSFTAIAYPLPEIGEDFEEIFRETVRINTLDNDLYTRIQQAIIDTLDQAAYVRVRGVEGKNSTDICVTMHPITDPDTQTNFENCVADVNIPVGEVFTSPVLKGTTGTINVSSVYLDHYNYNNLTIELKDGMVVDYKCDNFEDAKANKEFIRETIFQNRETLPLGEFAIGTNTTAYVMASKFGIIQKLPILIVEKMGPHFALGDTCYKHSEDHKVYNPNGKEIIARENECSALRNTEPEKAYFNCHTDITIPYDEIGEISAVKADGTAIVIIENGRFVLEGTESLNEAFA